MVSMPYLDTTETFDPDSFDAEVIGVATSLDDHDSGSHQHQRGQLLYARRGCVRITLADRLCLLPPSRAVWIPPLTAHRAVMQQAVDYRSLWFRPDLSDSLPGDVRVIDVRPLLRAVLESIEFADFHEDWRHGRQAHLLGLCIHEIRDAPQEAMLLPLPTDRRLVKLTSRPDRMPPELQVLGGAVGASSKTITRIFQRETGMGYQQWRQQWRLMRAIELLATGHSITYTAAELEFSSDSVFIAFFRKMLGDTPRSYLDRSQQN
jgi:AraC-like DNA-binding protein